MKRKADILKETGYKRKTKLKIISNGKFTGLVE